jgi:hypothetical protein
MRNILAFQPQHFHFQLYTRMIKSFIVERLFLSLGKFKLNHDSCEELVLSKMFSDTILFSKIRKL